MLTEELPKNKILAGLPTQERDLLLPSCEMVQLYLGDPIEASGKPIQFLHFPLNSAISITTIQDFTHMVEITVIGKEGCNGSSLVQGDDRSICTAMVQIPGTAVRIPTPALLEQLPRLQYLGSALSRHTLLLMRTAVISVGCSTYHTVPQRLARWLKAHWHRTGIESFPFSTQFLSAIVGAEPTVVAEVLEEFKSRGIVETTRNKVTITDQDALAKQSCECYELAKIATDEYMVALTNLVRTHESP